MRSGDLESFVAAHPSAVVAELTAVRGSSPRNAGTFMVIAPAALIGTIGGGALEYMVIDRARQALRNEEEPAGMDIPLGPEIGQCCGGRVEVSLRRMTAAVGLPTLRLIREAVGGYRLDGLAPGKVRVIDTRLKPR